MADDIYIHPAPVAMATKMIDHLKSEFKAKQAQENAVLNAYMTLQNVCRDVVSREDDINIIAVQAAMTQVEDAFPALFTPEELDDSMDGDHASALASAGWGTTEDYGDPDERF